MGCICSCIGSIFQLIGDCIMGIVACIAGCIEWIVSIITGCCVGICDCIAGIFCCGRHRRSVRGSKV
ncbi:hypothetical protein BD410DRAFT_745781 [Rickenella mellea]|uniref:Uncharacterized protein n=1 Tax=Rickenella mellea TaxID=50990 RepID=A0A4Y7QA87_9AGAM|nr:hypothetical protein BD410DRAFT_745781 [Rickenella mellea]